LPGPHQTRKKKKKGGWLPPINPPSKLLCPGQGRKKRGGKRTGLFGFVPAWVRREKKREREKKGEKAATAMAIIATRERGEESIYVRQLRERGILCLCSKRKKKKEKEKRKRTLHSRRKEKARESYRFFHANLKKEGGGGEKEKKGVRNPSVLFFLIGGGKKRKKKENRETRSAVSRFLGMKERGEEKKKEKGVLGAAFHDAEEKRGRSLFSWARGKKRGKKEKGLALVHLRWGGGKKGSENFPLPSLKKERKRRGLGEKGAPVPGERGGE